MIDAASIASARAVPIAHEIHHRGLKLRRLGRELAGPCPVCGGRDRFAVHPRKGAWNCRRCGKGGDVIALVRHIDGSSFPDAVATLAGRPLVHADTRAVLAMPPAGKPASRPPREDRKGTEWALHFWKAAVPIAGTLAERYLVQVRGLVLPADVSPRVLRFHPRCPFEHEIRPCLLALYRDVFTDEPRAIMRTALTPDARKIARKAFGPIGGAAIKLSDNADVSMALTIGEGLETTLAGLLKGFAPAWALGSAGGIAKLPVLSGIEALTVLAETGDGGANERAVRECFSRWNAAGREVYRATSLIGGDMNDCLMMA